VALTPFACLTVPQARPSGEPAVIQRSAGKGGAVCLRSIFNENTIGPQSRRWWAANPRIHGAITYAIYRPDRSNGLREAVAANPGNCRPSAWPHRPVQLASMRAIMLSFMPSELCGQRFCSPPKKPHQPSATTSPCAQMAGQCDEAIPVAWEAIQSFPPGRIPATGPVFQAAQPRLLLLCNPKTHRHSPWLPS